MLLCSLSLLLASLSLGLQKVSLDSLNNGGWESMRGQRVEITTPLYVCGTPYGELLLSPERLYVPEEKAWGLADGDSTAYYQRREYNAQRLIRLAAPYDWKTTCLGSQVVGLQAHIDGPRRLSSGSAPRFTKSFKSFKGFKSFKRFELLEPLNPLPSPPPEGRSGGVSICSSNIQNFFVHLGGYASKRTTPEQFALQRLKIASALVRMNADIYALCELEKGPSAPAALAAEMNRLTRRGRFAYVDLGACDGDTISVGFIYRTDRVAPYGPMRLVYRNTSDIYAYRFALQGFEEKATGERFVISLNHLRSKRVGEGQTPESVHGKRMANVDSVLTAIRQVRAENLYDDEDFLLLGDYNSYTAEAPIQAFVRAGFEDLLMRDDSLGYSYVYQGEMGYLDRAFASPSMAAQVCAVHPVHLNTDFPYAWSATSRYAVRKQRKHRLYRYSDHDPLLLYIQLR